MSYTGLEQKKVHEIAAEYRAQGYDVFVTPGPESLPGFLADFRPDLVVRKAGESIVVEVKVGTETAASERFLELAETIRHQPGWKFSLVIVDPKSDEVAPATQQLISTDEIRKRLDKAGELLGSGSADAAFLLIWSSIEALLRHIAEQEALPLDRAPTSSLIKELYSQGVLSRSEFNLVQRAFTVRNALAHGFIADDLDKNSVPLLELASGLLTRLTGSHTRC